MNIWLTITLLSAVFVLTYDPKSGKLEKYIGTTPTANKEKHFQEIQFGGGLKMSHEKELEQHDSY
jgi:hypothetical protein